MSKATYRYVQVRDLLAVCRVAVRADLVGLAAPENKRLTISCVAGVSPTSILGARLVDQIERWDNEARKTLTIALIRNGSGCTTRLLTFPHTGPVVGAVVAVWRSDPPPDESSLVVLNCVMQSLQGSLQRPVLAAIERTSDGWLVDGSPLDDLASALSLVDLLHPPLPTRRKPLTRKERGLEDVVLQLQYALQTRTTVEQAIGVLVERFAMGPRAAFERLRRVATRQGRPTRDIAQDVVTSATSAIPLPLELRSPTIRARRHRAPVT